jgi:hypothetical protein
VCCVWRVSRVMLGVQRHHSEETQNYEHKLDPRTHTFTWIRISYNLFFFFKKKKNSRLSNYAILIIFRYQNALKMWHIIVKN